MDLERLQHETEKILGTGGAQFSGTVILLFGATEAPVVRSLPEGTGAQAVLADIVRVASSPGAEGVAILTMSKDDARGHLVNATSQRECTFKLNGLENKV